MATFSTGDLTGLRSALRGQYSIERELGRGGMGVVFLARDERLDRPVALKVLPRELARRVETRERFLREARTAAQLSHPHIVPVYRADEIDDLAFFAMGYVEGETFADRIRDRAPLTAADTVRVLREVAWALAYAHARGIVHRDIKPENILLDRASGRALVSDFGIARSEFDPSLTADGYVLGTVHYMSPEQCAGDTLDGRSDLYALGVAGFYALSGRLPFEEESPQAIIVAHATRHPPSLRSIAPDVPAALADVIDLCLRKDPAHRYANGEALADALTKALESSAPATRTGPNARVLSTDEALVIWRRAAQLQAEAATRLEMRVRDGALAAESRPLPESSDETDLTTVRTDGYRAHDVEAAALEAGISQRYVALAMAELQGPAEIGARAASIPAWQDGLATRLFGTTQRSLSVSRPFRFPPRVVLAALGRVLQAHPYGLELLDTVGGHPLDGGVLVFKIPDMVGADYRWTWTRYGVYAPEVRVTIASLAGDARGCEVTMHLDLRPGLGANFIGFGIGIGGAASAGGAMGLAVGIKALALAGAALAVPVLGTAALVGMGAYVCSGPLYRWEIRKTSAELERTLSAIEASMRALDIFGEAPPAGRPRQAGSIMPLPDGGFVPME
jgi:eukaryotic-like serine/threonine-protein kinase